MLIFSRLMKSRKTFNEYDCAMLAWASRSKDVEIDIRREIRHASS
jgi:hypothetical protein